MRIRAGGELRSKIYSLLELPDKTELTRWSLQYLRLHVFVPPLEPGVRPPAEIVREARLFLLGQLANTVDPAEYSLDETVPVTLRPARK